MCCACLRPLLARSVTSPDVANLIAMRGGEEVAYHLFAAANNISRLCPKKHSVERTIGVFWQSCLAVAWESYEVAKFAFDRQQDEAVEARSGGIWPGRTAVRGTGVCALAGIQFGKSSICRRLRCAGRNKNHRQRKRQTFGRALRRSGSTYNDAVGWNRHGRKCRKRHDQCRYRLPDAVSRIEFPGSIRLNVAGNWLVF
jgi:hypothetical protein